MSKQLALSSALSVLMMAAVALFAGGSDSRPASHSVGRPVIGSQALIR
jgi:hypothetical protein